MKKKAKVKLSFKDFSIGQKLIFLLLVIVIIELQIFFVHLSILKASGKIREEAEDFGQNISSIISFNLVPNISLSQVVKNIYLEYGNDENFHDEFYSLCKRYQQDNKSVGAIYIAPDGIIKYAYPESSEQLTIGSVVGEYKFANKAKNLRISTVAGPHVVLEGNVGLIFTDPIYVENDFLGYTSTIVDWKDFSETLLARIKRDNVRNPAKEYSDSNMKFKFGIVSSEDLLLITNEHGFILANTDQDIERKVSVKIDVPGSKWTVYVEPVTGWQDYSSTINTIILVFLVGMALIVLVGLRIIDEAKRSYIYEHDPLTGVYTRSAFYRRVKKILKNNPERNFNVILTDIVHFNMINSSEGTDKGDEVLCYLANIFKNDSYNHEICGRYGGDQFIFLLAEEETLDRAFFEQHHSKIIANSPVKNLKLKYGLYTRIDKNLPVNQIADRALIAVKSIINNYDMMAVDFTGELENKHAKVQLMESLFFDAIKKEQFKVFFQPQVNAKNGYLIGFEALVRWDKGNGQFYSPGDFIPVFENDGLIHHLDVYVFEKVCQFIKKWMSEGLKIVPISVNISRYTMNDYEVIRSYGQIIKKYGIPINSVSLEITESADYSTDRLVSLTKILTDDGFDIEMDDFGTGASSLVSLNILPFSVIKMDKSLIDYIGTEDGDELIKHIIELSHYKKMEVIAEGVEENRQLDFLKANNCDFIQGYLFSKPIPLEDTEKMLKDYNEKGMI